MNSCLADNSNNHNHNKMNGIGIAGDMNGGGNNTLTTTNNNHSSSSATPIASPSSLPSPSSLSSRTVPAVPFAVLICQKNSHPFQERKITLDTPLKIGRAVAKVRPGLDNAIFDCKVLSRNHAVVWYEEGKFFIKDTHSSNGTFLNNVRLALANEESQPREVCSGDIIQFGVDVMENSKKVTHGCIVATIKLFNPDGSEAKLSSSYKDGENAKHHHLHHSLSSSSSSSHHHNHHSTTITITTQELYELSQLLTEALHRESILENKLTTLSRVVSMAQEAADNGWKSLVEEDRLLSRVESLQGKLEICLNVKNGLANVMQMSVSNNNNINNTNETNDKEKVASTQASSSLPHEALVNNLRDEMVKLVDDKEKYESAAKEAIQKALEEKLQVLTKVHHLETVITSSEDECNRLKEVADHSTKEIQLLTVKIDELNKDIDEVSEKLRKSDDSSEELKKEKCLLEEKVAQLVAKEKELTNVVNELKSLNETSQTTIEQLKNQIVSLKQERMIRFAAIPTQESIEGQGVGGGEKVFDKEENEITLDRLQRQLVSSNVTSQELKAQIDKLEGDIKSESQQVNQLDQQVSVKLKGEGESDESDDIQQEEIEKVIDLASTSLTALPSSKGDDSITSNTSSANVEENLVVENVEENQQISSQIEKVIEKVVKPEVETTESIDSNSATTKPAKVCVTNDQQQLIDNQPECDQEIKKQEETAAPSANDNSQTLDSTTPTVVSSSTPSSQIKSTDIELLNELLTETRASKASLEQELSKTLSELQSVKLSYEDSCSECEVHISTINRVKKELQDTNQQLKSSKSQTDRVCKELVDTKRKLEEVGFKLKEAEACALLKDKEIGSLKGLLDEERKIQQKFATNLEQCRKQLVDAQAIAKQSQTESELLRQKVYSANEELRSSRSSTSSNSISESDFSALKARLKVAEQELHHAKEEIFKWEDRYQQLSNSYQKAQQLKDAIESKKNYERGGHRGLNGVDANDDFSSVKEEIVKLKSRLDESNRSNESLREDLKQSKEDYEIVAYQGKIASACAIVPLIMLLIAILIAYYPSVSTVTGTSGS